MTIAILSAAHVLCEAGLSVVPIALDGTKRPLVAWARYQEQPPTPNEIDTLFARPCGLAVICGGVSGNAEVVDVDDSEARRGLVDALADDEPSLLARLVLVGTPSGGLHLWYRHSGEPEGNHKLALGLAAQAPGPDPAATPARVTLIETRGQGGYCIVPPSPAAVHPNGQRYSLLQGTLRQLPTLTAQERATLHTLARAQGRYVPTSSLDRAQGAASTRGVLTVGAGERTRPGDAYNARASWESLLLPRGWVIAYRRGSVTAWRRPGKPTGISATTGYGDSTGAQGAGLLYVFSSNAAPFEPDTSYSPFAAYTLLVHGGDWTGATRALAARGYGDPPTSLTPRTEPTIPLAVIPLSVRASSDSGMLAREPAPVRVPLFVGAWARRVTGRPA